MADENTGRPADLSGAPDDERAAGGENGNNERSEESGGSAKNGKKNGKKKILPIVLTAIAAALLSTLVTLLLCHRYMYLDTQKEYERKLADLSQELAPPEDKTRFTDLADKFKAVYAQFRDAVPGAAGDEEIGQDLLRAFVSLCGDKNARVYTAEEYAAMQTSGGASAGIGVTVVRSAEGRAYITYTEKDGPAQAAGIKDGDELIAVDGLEVSAGYDEALDAIRGKEKTTVRLTVRRGEGTQEIIVTRGKVTYSTVHVRTDEEHACGYIEILSFGSNAPKEFEEAIGELTAAGIKKAVIDLRGNGGGSLTSLHKTLDLLLPDADKEGSAKLAFFTKDAADNEKRYVCSDEKEVPEIEIVLLTDDTTAGEAEIFACALRENGVKTVGSKTKGDVSLVSRYTLKDGTVLYFTSGYCYPPSGADLTGVGAEPDRTVDSGSVNRLLAPFEDPVYLAALEVLAG